MLLHDPRQTASTRRIRSVLGVSAALTLAAACTTTTATPSPTGSGSPAASPSISSKPSATPSTAASSSPTASASLAGPWQPAGSMSVARGAPIAIDLGDGRVLVLEDAPTWVGDAPAPTTAELWDPTTGTWHTTESLPGARLAFAGVALRDGRALVIGGYNGTDASYSSAYVFDPGPGKETWTKVGLLGTARTAPAAAVLPDGRVLVAGGYFHTGETAAAGLTPDISLVAYRAPSVDASQGPAPPDDVDVPPHGYALATAELFDPATGQWSGTGAMAYARVGAAAVTLPDGRILVVGSGPENVSRIHPEAYETAEIYDPSTGQFSPAGRLPDIDRAGLKELGVEVPDGDPQPAWNGALVALPDGGALLVGHASWWKHQGDIGRTLRFDVAMGTWREVGRPAAVVWNNDTGGTFETPDTLRLYAAVTGLSDGRVLVAGGVNTYQSTGTTLDSAEAYDPATDAWTTVAPMPMARQGAASVLLGDRSVLHVGGSDWDGDQIDLASAIRFVPSP